jgi:hypothetical protein
MKTWFANCKNEAEIKSLYRALAREHHPDLGGNTATMQEVNAAYEAALRCDYSAQGMNQEKADARWELDKELAAKVADVFRLRKELSVELCGVWLWITGQTWAATAELKAIGCKFAPKKRCWYFRREVDGGHRRHGKTLSLDAIRTKYGSRALRPDETRQPSLAF